MFYIKIADLTVRIKNHYPGIEKQCFDFITEQEDADISIEIDESVLSGQDSMEQQFPPDYQESIQAYTRMNELLIPYHGFILHASVIEIDGHGCAFLAPSGMGKSTQTRLWKQVYGDRCRVINGDKPIIRIIDGKVYAYGTPWCGKEGWTSNDLTELETILFLEQGSEDKVFSMDQGEVIDSLFRQVLLPQNGEAVEELLALLDVFIRKVRAGRLICTKTEAAVQAAYSYIAGGWHEDEK